MLTLEAIGYRYAGATTPSLTGLDLELRDHDVLGIVGASEAGKSTLCLVAAGLAPRTIGGRLEGRVLLDGEPTADRPIHDLVREVGIVFQHPGTQLSGVAETVFEEVAFGAMNLGMARSSLVTNVWTSLERLEIAELAERDPRHLSGGQQQLVAVAGILAMQPRHVVLDEPTAQLDSEGSRLVGDALTRLARAGASIMICEHRTDLLASICTRVAVLDAGRIVALGTADEVLADPRLPDWGAAPPSIVRLRRLAAARGIDPGQLQLEQDGRPGPSTASGSRR